MLNLGEQRQLLFQPFCLNCGYIFFTLNLLLFLILSLLWKPSLVSVRDLTSVDFPSHDNITSVANDSASIFKQRYFIRHKRGKEVGGHHTACRGAWVWSGSFTGFLGLTLFLGVSKFDPVVFSIFCRKIAFNLILQASFLFPSPLSIPLIGHILLIGFPALT